LIKETIFSKKNLVLLSIIAAIALVLSILSYQYYVSASNQVIKLAAEDIRSNARIQVHDLSTSLANKLDSVTSNLRLLSTSPTVQSNEYDRATTLIDSAKNSTSQLVDFYMWLDRTGKILWISNINQTIYQKYSGTDLSYRPYFILPRDTLKPFYSSTINSNDNVPRLYISYPIVSNVSTVSKNNSNSGNYQITRGMVEAFKGVMVAAIKIDTLGNLLHNELSSPEFQSNLGLLDNKGTILYISNKAKIFSEISNLLNRSFQSNNTGSNDIVINDKINTIAYEPVVIGGMHFMTLYVAALHNFASNVGEIIDQQRNYSIFVIVLIGGVAIGIASLVLLWNKRLKAVVNSKTAEIGRTNNSLVESNKLLAEANEQLKVHDKMQKEFINVAAHELRTPIQPILGLTQILYNKIKNDEQRGILDVIIRNARRLCDLTENILDVTKIESHSLQLKKERFRLNEKIVNVINEVTNQAEARSNDAVQILFEPKGDLFVDADKVRIYQVISNLLNNAIKFTKEGYITISAEKDEDRQNVVVTVKDTGIGIDPEILPKLFTKFTTRSNKGTGLGLFISKSIVESHGGKIWAENNSDGNRGATFYFSIPISNENNNRRPDN
jgi:signal transduction histidine kinase/Tfp pilus assembly major pilin PilA